MFIARLVGKEKCFHAGKVTIYILSGINEMEKHFSLAGKHKHMLIKGAPLDSAAAESCTLFHAPDQTGASREIKQGQLGNQAVLNEAL